jgi:hypothetical protein
MNAQANNEVSVPKNHPAYIISLLHVNNRAVERAMVVLYANKVQPNETSYYTSWVNSGKALSGFHLERARMIALANVSCLVKLATKKLEKKNSLEKM